MRFPKRNRAVSGAVDIPIIPIIFLVCVFALVVAYNSMGHVTLTQGFKIESTDVAVTSLVAQPDKKMEVLIHLIPPVAERLKQYASAHPSSGIPIILNGDYVGEVTVTPGADTSVLSIMTTPEKAMSVRYQVGR